MNQNGALETRSVLRIVCRLGQHIRLHVWCHGLRHTSITQAAELWQRVGLGLDIRAFSRHRTMVTLMMYGASMIGSRRKRPSAISSPARSRRNQSSVH